MQCDRNASVPLINSPLLPFPSALRYSKTASITILFLISKSSYNHQCVRMIGKQDRPSTFVLANKPSSSFSSISAASATSAATSRSGGSKLLFGEIDTSSDRCMRNPFPVPHHSAATSGSNAGTFRYSHRELRFRLQLRPLR